MAQKLESDPTDESFEISAVSRLTGISTHTLRIWERRYGLVSPSRSNSRRRRYSREDIRHLTLIKTLLDHGDSIGTIASLSVPQLEGRIRQNLANSGSGFIEGVPPEDPVVRVAVAGETVPFLVEQTESSLHEMKVVAKADSTEDLRSVLKPSSVDIIVIEQTTMFPGDIERIQEFVEELGARRGVVVYHFSQRKTLQEFERDVRKLTALKAPVTSTELRLACLADILMLQRSTSLEGERATVAETNTKLPEIGNEIPEKRFSPRQLDQLSRIASAVQCECPKHLASILTCLGGFEEYSQKCESRNVEDAKLHAHLHRTTAEARRMMEEALSHVLEAEGIELD